MSIETAIYVNQLDAVNPLATDPKSEGDNHLRLLKAVLLATFPNLGGAMTVGQARLNLLQNPQLADVTAGTAPNFTVASPQVVPTAYADNQLYIVTFHDTGTTGSNTLNIAGLGAKAIKQLDYTSIGANAVIVAGQTGLLVYDAAMDVFVLLNPLPPQAQPTGMITSFPATVPPTGWAKANGSLVTRSGVWAPLWAFAQTSGNLVTEAAWAAGRPGSFSSGDGSTTFRIPDFRGLFLRGYHDGSGTYETATGTALGQYRNSQNKAHTHSLKMDGGIFAAGTSPTASAHSLAATLSETQITDSGSAEAFPRNVPVLVCIKL